MRLRQAGAATENAEAAARETEAERRRLGRRAAGGGDDGDGNGGGEAARGRTITEQAASVLWRLQCAAACGTCSWRELRNLTPTLLL